MLAKIFKVLLPEALGETQKNNSVASSPSPQNNEHLIPEQKEEVHEMSVIDSFKSVVQELDKIFVRLGDGPVANLPQSEITTLVRQIPLLVMQSGDNAHQYAISFAQVLFNRLFENSNPIFQEMQLVSIKAIRDVDVSIGKDITNWVIMLPEEHSFNAKAILGLIRFQLIKVSSYDVQLAKMVQAGSQKAIELAIILVKSCCIEGRFAKAMAEEFSRTIALLKNLPGIEGLGADSQPQQENNNNNNVSPPANISTASTNNVSSKVDPVENIDPTLLNNVSSFFKQWVHTLCKSEKKDPDTCLALLRSIGQTNAQLPSIINAQNLAALINICTKSVVETAYQLSSPGSTTISWYKYVDALTPLLVLLVRHAQPGEELVMPKGESPAKLLVRRLTVVLNVLVKIIIQDHDSKGTEFRQRVHFRIFSSLQVMLFQSMIGKRREESEEIKALKLQTALVFSDSLLLLAPTVVPGFTFAWLELASHRLFMPTLLLANPKVGWLHFQKLLLELFKFLQPFLEAVELPESVHVVYKGTIRVLLVLLHDFPEFLCDYHYSFCDVIPSTCVQMRNLILSAFPRKMRLPDPFQSLKIDLLPEIQHDPDVRSDYLASLGRVPAYTQSLDACLAGKSNSFARHFRETIQYKDEDSGRLRYNIPLMNATVLLCGVVAIQQPNPGVAFPLSHPRSLEVFNMMLSELDAEGRYFVLNGVANQLRYPNKHTYYFSCLLLYMFASNSNHEFIQEQIARVLLERLIVNRPHPWGLLVTFIELIKNESYNFQHCAFIHCAPEIENLFDSVENHMKEKNKE